MAPCHLCCSNGFVDLGSISMNNIKPLYTEKNRTALAERMVKRMTYDELIDYDMKQVKKLKRGDQKKSQPSSKPLANMKSRIH